MPTYEYECTSCGQHIEVFQRISENALTTCGVCGGALRKVFHPVGIVFKGSGFYATDSRAAAKAGASKDEGGGSGSEGAASSGREGASASGSDAASSSADGGASTTGSSEPSRASKGSKASSPKERSSS